MKLEEYADVLQDRYERAVIEMKLAKKAGVLSWVERWKVEVSVLRWAIDQLSL